MCLTMLQYSNSIFADLLLAHTTGFGSDRLGLCRV